MKEGNYLVNSRVDVEFSKGKPKIKFGCPKKDIKKEEKKQAGYGIIPIIFSLVIILILCIPIYSFWETNYPENCSATFNQYSFEYNHSWIFNGINYSSYTKGNYILGMNVSCDTGNFTYYYSTYQGTVDNIYRKGFKENINIKNSIIFISLMTILWALIFILPLIVGKILIKFKWYRKFVPRFEGKRGRRYYKRFKKEDVEHNLVEINYFSNVYLDYKATEDFSKYLYKIKIRENNRQPFKIKRGKMIKKKKIEKGWYARFLFTKKPEKGYLEVIYR